ncbi:hypothetical protein N7499_009737 [Penicillium canescens]|uniref:DUF7820 domain-containing protein n=1 Tax=Penicillium canescens TaxID=5083 RepID=A0AAD6NDT8_PENCN|nr:uncharacterized protein N7446_008242 [Penicillium canescens]KAJ6033465.1 hypothetical protein N7444_011236 [Penicillium canescens]KAJ6057343.1 hypothetical protein N7460_000617 [Penicillium canescens]KAJ6058659.1 hypothetical protein N7446_008242 [Penicillium canescens]KAJ6071723.1 hypothetical protein N7499_009737 [Penicillium canescens]KAJ6170403.1 hypothetical protein N7485_007749 [Penicillium canescens]
MSGHISSEHSRSASRSSQTPRLSQGDSMSRHSFGRNSRVSNPNVFADEYSLEPIDADRIERPHSPSSIASSATLRENNQPPKTVSTATTENENPFGDDARLSFDEPHRSSLPQKGWGFSNNRNSTASINTTPSMIQRNQSVSSRFSIPRALSPYTGATGPSHPYGMYPQVGVSRSPSVGSTSTIRPVEQPIEQSTGPQHPYAMYSQNVVEEGIDDSPIPVGFPGHNPPYQPPAGRQDDDVGDIIGPDGHTEPLPPYSRYPTGVVPKPPGAETMADLNTPPEEHRLNNEALPSNEAAREPPVSETSSRALVLEHSGDGNNGRNGGERAAGTTGIMAFEEKLKRKGKQTACCGLPVWTLVLIATVLLIGGCIGGVIGGVLGTKRAAEASKADEEAQKSHGPPIVTVTATPQMDASMISTPTNIKSVPTGHFMVPSGFQNGSGMCVDENNYGKAWKCLQSPSEFEVFVGQSKGHHSIVFDYGAPTTTFTYGAQAPYWSSSPTQALSMAVDTTDIGMGPALFFVSSFDKLVIAPEDTFSLSSLNKRTWVDDGWAQAEAYKNLKKTAQVGDKPWFCWWNNTRMEFFMYVNQSIADSASSTTTASADSNMAASTAGAHQESKRGSNLSDYPRRIKMEERRDDPTRENPYCQQMQIRSDGGLALLSGMIVNIKENEPTPTTTYTSYNGGTVQTYTAQASYVSPCYCISLTD